MKKFKSILALTASVLALSAFAAPVSAFAADTIIDQTAVDPLLLSGAYDLQYTADETYTVTIPATPVQISGDTAMNQNTISVSNVRLNATHSKVKVTIDSANKENGAFAMALAITDAAPYQYDSTTKLAYTAKVNGATDNLSIGDTVIEVGNATNGTELGNGTASLDFTITGTPLKAGTYRDTLTFTVSLVNAG